MSHTTSSGWSRRQFLKTSLAVAPAVITSNALGAGAVPPASDRIVMGAIGIGGRGSSDLGSFLTHSDVQVVAVCDVKRTNRLRAQGMANGRYGNKDCKAYIDLRELLERADIGLIIIIIAVLFLLVIGGLSVALSRLKVNQAIKLGEEA